MENLSVIGDRRESVASITSIGGDASPSLTPNVPRSCPNAYRLGAESSKSPPCFPLIHSQACELAEEEAETALLRAVSRKNMSLNLHMRAALAFTSEAVGRVERRSTACHWTPPP